MKPLNIKHQSGASLIEVLVAVLVLSLGLLALGSMLAYAVQLPKFAAYRATATFLASNHIEQMRANPAAFRAGEYKETMTYNQSLASVTLCKYPDCTPAGIAANDKAQTSDAIRQELPLGGMRMVCNGPNNDPCKDLGGDLWILWQEPTTFSPIGGANSDECPNPAQNPSFDALDAAVRCLHVRFQL